MACESVGEARPDIAGIGILVSFAVQAFISLAAAIWVYFLSRRWHFDTSFEEETQSQSAARKKLKLASDILITGNDIQVLVGIAYMINGFALSPWLDIYHLHLMFDVVSFVGVSNAATLVFWSFCAAKVEPTDSQWRSKHDKKSLRLSRFSPRYRASYLFAALFLGLTVLLCIRLNEWDDSGEIPGRCYMTDYVTLPNASHPAVDKTYVAITAAWMLVVMFAAVLGRQSRRRLLLILASLQFPVHLYMMIALRSANQGLFEEGRSENDWDFGQTTTLVLLALTMVEMGTKVMEYRRFAPEENSDKSTKLMNIDAQKGDGVRETEASIV